jgi:hypothetical protein
MSGWMKIAAYVLITVFLGFILRELGFQGARLVGLLGAVVVVGAGVIGIGEIFSMISLSDESGREYVCAMLKIVGVGYVFGICSDICAQMGETGLSSAACLFGRVEIITISLPFIKRIVEKGIELI